MSMLDYRKLDERTNVRPNPFWVQSAILHWDGANSTTDGDDAMDDAQTVIMSLGLNDGFANPIYIQYCVVRVIVAFVGGTPLIDVGNGTIPAVGNEQGATVSAVDVDSIMTTAVLLPAATGLKKFTPTTNGNLLVPADTTTPVIYASLTSGSPITAGSLQVAVLLSEIMW